MDIDIHASVGDLAVKVPHATRVFERFGIDYCCGGKRSLAEACEKKGIPVAKLVDGLRAEQGARAAASPVAHAPTADIIRHVVDKHHAFTRTELTRLVPLAAKVHRVHGDGHPELARVHELVVALHDELMPHMMKEEHVLFPALESLARGESTYASFVRHPVAAMTMEHEQCGEELAELEALTTGFAAPDGACGSYRALYDGLRELTRDLHEHIHLENNVLFARALSGDDHLD